MKKKEFLKYLVLQGNNLKCLGVTENFSFTQASYEYVEVINRMFVSEKFHIRHIHLTVQVKHSYTLPSLCVFYFTGNK